PCLPRKTRGRPGSRRQGCWLPRPGCSPRGTGRGGARPRWPCCAPPPPNRERPRRRACGTGPAWRWPGRWPPPGGWAWTDNPAFFAVRQAHLAASQLVADILAAGAGDPVDDAKAALMLGFLLDAAAPTNFLLTNPAALKRALETGGASVMAGAAHMAD